MTDIESFDYSPFTGNRRPLELVTVFEATNKHKDLKKRRTTGQAWNAANKGKSKIIKHPLPKRH